MRIAGGVVVVMLVGAATASADPAQPHFAIAAAYGAHGWQSLCESRGNPALRGADIDELAAYVHAWCAPTSDDRLEALHGLAHAKTPGLATAARADALAMLAGSRTGNESLAWLERHGDRPSDDLAAEYAASGQCMDAFAVGSERWKSRGDYQTPTCRRVRRFHPVKPDKLEPVRALVEHPERIDPIRPKVVRDAMDLIAHECNLGFSAQLFDELFPKGSTSAGIAMTLEYFLSFAENGCSP